MKRTPSEAIRAAVPWALLVALAAAFTLQHIHSLDAWWHLRTGQLIAETGAFPRVDVFTYTTRGERWIDLHWLFQLGLWGLHRAGGVDALVLAKFALVGATLALLAPIGYRRQRSWVTVAALALLLWASCHRFMVRPELVSIVLLAVTVRLLDRFERRGDLWIYGLIPLQVVWANVQSLFALATVLCAIHLVAELVRPLGSPETRLRPARLAHLAAVTALTVLASLVNPNGVDGAMAPLALFDWQSSATLQPVFARILSELSPPFGTLPAPLLLPWLLLAGLALGAIALNWRSVRLSDPLVWTAFFYISSSALRNVALFAVVAAPLLVRNVNALLDERPPPRAVARAAPLLLCALLAWLAFDVARGSFYARVGLVATPGLGVEVLEFPKGAADWIQRERPPGPLGHSLNEGGYLIWRLYPDYPVLIDGRTSFGPEHFSKHLILDVQSFERLDGEYEFGTVLAPLKLNFFGGIVRHLSSSAEWHLTYVDDVAAVFVRASPGAPLSWSEVDLDAPDLFPPVEPPVDLGDERRLRNRTDFFIRVGRPDLALATWERAIALFPDLAGAMPVRRQLRDALLRSPDGARPAPR